MASVLGASVPATPQALSQVRVGDGVELYVVTLPLADAVTACWPRPTAPGGGDVVCRTGGALTAIADIEAGLRAEAGDGELSPAPPVVAIVGGGAVSELVAAVNRAVGGRPIAVLSARAVEPLREGMVERRLGAQGSDATVRLSIPLPPVEDPSRTSVETLWELLPGLLRAEAPQLLARVEGGRGVLESRHEPELWEGDLGRLRAGVARVASAPALDAGSVSSAAARIAVRRLALLESHPEGAKRVVELDLAGGGAAVREYLFGTSGVTLDSVRRAATAWLPQHPGAAEVTLPPRVLNPRFAPGPEVVRLGNDATAAVLERPTTPLAALVVRPVVVPDVDGRLSATVLARVAAEVRRQVDAPGWVRVSEAPPLLELATSADDLGGLAEALRAALDQVATDEREVTADAQDARRRTLSLAAGLLGLSELVAPTPAELLRPSNLALGVVATDGEAAVETMSKLLVGSVATADAATLPIPGGSRTREAVAGSRSAVAVVLPLDLSLSEGAGLVLEAVLRGRAARALSGVDTEVLRPLVPGRSVLLVVATAEGPMDALERRVAAAWPQLVRRLPDDELDAVRRQVAAGWSAAVSGAVGRARRAAAVAAGSVGWRAPADLELEILTVPMEALASQLEAIQVLKSLETCGAGLLPIPPPGPGSASD